jgi:hypothetical protein
MQVLNLEKIQAVSGGSGEVIGIFGGGRIDATERQTLSYIQGQYEAQASCSAAQFQWMDTYFTAFLAFNGN